VATVSRDERVVRVWRGLGIWLGLMLVLTRAVAAQTVVGAPRVTTSVDVCVPIARAQFQRVLAIELGTSIEFAPGAAQDSDGTAVQLGCEGPSGITLELHDALTHKFMRRSLELPAVDEATRTRLLALEVAEFVVASWVELQLMKRPETAGATTTGPTESAKQASRVVQARLSHEPVAPPLETAERSVDSRDSRWMLGVSVEAQMFSLGGGGLGQLSVHVINRPTPHLELGLVGSLATGSWPLPQFPTDTARVGLTSTSGKFKLNYIAPLGDVAELGVGAGVRFGLVHIAGESNAAVLRARQFYAPWGGPALQLSTCAHWEHLRLGLELEVGYVTLTARGFVQDTDIVQIEGVWGSAGAFAGWLF
jgi:hypothetical protein